MPTVRISGSVNPVMVNLDEIVLPRPRDIRQAVNDADVEFRKGRSATFRTEGSAGGDKWQPLSERYRRWKQKVRPGRKILVFDGNLRASLTRKSNADHVARSFKGSSGWIMQWGTDNVLAAYHGPGLFHNARLPIRDAMAMTQRQALRVLGAVRASFLRAVDTRTVRAAGQSRFRFQGR